MSERKPWRRTWRKCRYCPSMFLLLTNRHQRYCSQSCAMRDYWQLRRAQGVAS